MSLVGYDSWKLQTPPEYDEAYSEPPRYNRDSVPAVNQCSGSTPPHAVEYYSVMPNSLDLERLEQEREEATIDKAELFDFYHANWDKLIEEIKSLRKQKSK